MYRVKLFCLSVILLTICLANTHAAGDPVLGEEFARERCVHCHNVEHNGPFKQYPPSFAAIAVYRSEEQIYGRIIFPPLHSAMPQIGYMLTPDQVKHLVAYIKSLESNQFSK